MPDSTSEFSEHDDEPGGHSAADPLEQAQVTARALFLGAAGALSSDQRLLDSWTKRLAETFIRGWDTELEWEPSGILFARVTNYQAFGADVEEAELDSGAPHAIIANLPNVHLAAALDIDVGQMNNLFRIGEDLAARLGGVLTWISTDDGSIRLEVSAT